MIQSLRRMDFTAGGKKGEGKVIRTLFFYWSFYYTVNDKNQKAHVLTMGTRTDHSASVWRTTQIHSTGLKLKAGVHSTGLLLAISRSGRSPVRRPRIALFIVLFFKSIYLNGNILALWNEFEISFNELLASIDGCSIYCILYIFQSIFPPNRVTFLYRGYKPKNKSIIVTIGLFL